MSIKCEMSSIIQQLRKITLFRVCPLIACRDAGAQLSGSFFQKLFLTAEFDTFTTFTRSPAAFGGGLCKRFSFFS
jgi:hypothetical protein